MLTLAAAFAAHACARFGYELLDSETTGAAPDQCANQLLDADETDVDCGGPTCPSCAEGTFCSADSDCASTLCQASTCRPPTCADGEQNSDETGLDCGGACSPCDTGGGCSAPSDCASNNCVNEACVAATCSDGIQNQDETGTDCGGSICAACATESCSDGIQNQDETGTDCGGSTCAACGTESCSDGIQNQDEIAVDCGGSTCPACESCSDGIQNQDETGTDCGGSVCTACGVNTPPLARMTVTPGIGSHDGTATVFQGDAGATTDREDAAGALTYSWDWDNDGTTDDSGVTSTHTYGAAGLFEARVTVQDTGGLSATATFLVVVTSSSDVVLVTTAADENDGGATPASPGGSGLSLREAITFSNGAAGRQSILVPAGFTIPLASELPSPSDVDIVADGAVIDGSSVGGSDDCLDITTPGARIFGLEIRNCSRSPLRLAFAAAGSHFSRLNVHDNAQSILLNGNNVRFGPDNEVSRSDANGLDVVSVAPIIDRNYIHDCADRGVNLGGSSDAALVLGNVIARCGTGIFFGNGADDISILHNVVHGNGIDGMNTGTTLSGIVMQNNIFSANTGFGVRTGASVLSANSHNLYFENTAGTCSGCSSLGAGSLTSDPLYMDVASDDFRLQPSSPCVDAGTDTGNDVNGAAPGLFNGANPDIGARESSN